MLLLGCQQAGVLIFKFYFLLDVFISYEFGALIARKISKDYNLRCWLTLIGGGIFYHACFATVGPRVLFYWERVAHVNSREWRGYFRLYFLGLAHSFYV
jgi:hypothetical protein